MKYIRYVLIASVIMICSQADAKNLRKSVVAEQKEAESPALSDQKKQEAVRLAHELAEKAKLLPQDIYEKLNAASVAGPSFSEEQLEKLLKSVMGLAVPKTQKNQELRLEIAHVQDLVAKKLQSYKVTGYSFAIDPNGAFFVDNQDPEFVVVYKDAKGTIKTRRYLASIDSIGLKIEFALCFNLIFFTDTAMNFYDSEKVIELGQGFEMNLWPLKLLNREIFREPFVPLVPRNGRFFDPNIPRVCSVIGDILGKSSMAYVPFKNMSGGLVLLRYSFGFSENAFSLVTGGTLTPLA